MSLAAGLRAHGAPAATAIAEFRLGSLDLVQRRGGVAVHDGLGDALRVVHDVRPGVLEWRVEYEVRSTPPAEAAQKGANFGLRRREGDGESLRGQKEHPI